MSTSIVNKRAELIRIALTIDEESISKLFDYAKQIEKKQQFPCQYTVEEVKQGIQQSVTDVMEGRVISYDELVKRYS